MYNINTLICPLDTYIIHIVIFRLSESCDYTGAGAEHGQIGMEAEWADDCHYTCVN